MNDESGMKPLGAIGRMRLVSQRITHAAFRTPGEVVAWMGAMQAQDYAGAKWSIGLRLAAGTEAKVSDMLWRGARKAANLHLA